MLDAHSYKNKSNFCVSVLRLISHYKYETHYNKIPESHIKQQSAPSIRMEIAHYRMDIP